MFDLSYFDILVSRCRVAFFLLAEFGAWSTFTRFHALKTRRDLSETKTAESLEEKNAVTTPSSFVEYLNVPYERFN
jgi:hypothetical protein